MRVMMTVTRQGAYEGQGAVLNAVLVFLCLILTSTIAVFTNEANEAQGVKSFVHAHTVGRFSS